MKSEHVTTVLVFLAIAFLQFLVLALAAALLDIPGVTAARLCGGAIVLHLAALTVKKAGE